MRVWTVLRATNLTNAFPLASPGRVPSSVSGTPAVSGVTRPISTSNCRSAWSAMTCSIACSLWMSTMPSPDRSAATRTLARLRPILSWMTCSIWPKSVVTSKLKRLRELGHLRLGLAHLQLGVVLLDLLADLGELAAGVLDLGEVVVVGRLVQLELAFVLGQFLLGLLQFEGELRGRLAIAGVRYALIFASRFVTCALSFCTWRETRSTSARYCSSPLRPSCSCATARSYSYCICAIGSAVQKRLASLLILR